MAGYPGTGATAGWLTRFLAPKPTINTTRCCVNGPVVILNASQTGCAALVVNLNGVQHVPIMDLSEHQLVTLVKLIRHAIAQSGRNTLLPDQIVPMSRVL